LKEGMSVDFVRMVGLNFKVRTISSLLQAYLTSKTYDNIKLNYSGKFFGKDLYDEVHLYAEKAKAIALMEQYDIIHAHDWLTYLAGINAKELSGKPLVVHIHNTAFDRSGGNPNPLEYEIEKKGFEAADAIIAVSDFTRNKVIKHYGINPNKVFVAHNGIIITDSQFDHSQFKIKEQDKVVLFLGRITLQKGPDYFIEAARRVLEHMDNVKFVIAGKGDMYHSMIERVAHMGLSDKILFTGFVPDEDLDKLYAMADVYVMPSVSEPFGITPLEAIRNDCPVIISKQSGVSEVINHCLKVDFWDINQLTDKIVNVLRYPVLQRTLREHGRVEINKITWDRTADKCIEVYHQVLSKI
ncbi:MAG: glycosyltransferase family 4 protein, partial [Candidatus Woesearchaeota archaeon]